MRANSLTTVPAGGSSEMDKLKYTISKGFQLFFNHLTTGFLSILTIATLLFFYLAVFSVNYSASKAIDNLTDIKTIRIFLEEGVDQKNIIKRLSELQMPASFVYYTKKEAKERVLRLVPGAKNIEKLPVDLFPTFVEMKFAEYASADALIIETANNIRNIGGVRTVEYGKNVSDKLVKVKYTSNIFLAFITLVTGFSASIIIFNTIRLNLYRQKRKIAIYNLVGATKMFITTPYLFASVLEASLSFLLAAVGNHLFIFGVTFYLLQNSYFVLFTPPAVFYVILYILLIFTAVFSAFICVTSFIKRLKSINEA